MDFPKVIWKQSILNEILQRSVMSLQTCFYKLYHFRRMRTAAILHHTLPDPRVTEWNRILSLFEINAFAFILSHGVSQIRLNKKQSQVCGNKFPIKVLKVPWLQFYPETSTEIQPRVFQHSETLLSMILANKKY